MFPQKRVLFLVPYPVRRAPSQRFRVENFLPYLDQASVSYKIAPFLDTDTFDILYRNGHAFRKVWGVVKGFLLRLKTVLLEAPAYDYVFIHREASPLGPPIFEWILAKVLRKKIIYDFDDAIWIEDSENKILNWVKAAWKIKWVCKWAHTVAAGNTYLAAFASRYNTNVVTLPTCVDMERQHNQVKQQNEGAVTIGWTGSHSTMRYLAMLVPVLQNLSERFGTEVVIISNRPPSFQFPGLHFLPWREATEIEDLLKVDIGIMPLEQDKWSEGKCGFKLIQYLALGIPAVASPVGINRSIVEHSVNGFLCNNTEQWQQALELLISDAALRKEMGQRGREKMLASYSVQSNTGCFLKLFSLDERSRPKETSL
ncbi:MAG: glycosyltransferase [Chitinophagaceae bacterium]|nr:MAG: glycosyltransferase [Chitinophagaceae bacterium]